LPLNETELQGALAERQMDSRVIDRWKSRIYYQDWQRELREVMDIYRGDWTMTWPDGRMERVDPAVPNLVRVAAEDRARGVGATPPNIICSSHGPTDADRMAADKFERIAAYWFQRNRIRGYTTQMWAHDAMSGGLTVCKVLPDFGKPVAERYPVMTRLDPQNCYPDPVFTPGPFTDSFIYSYEASRAEVEYRYDVTLEWNPRSNVDKAMEKVTVIEYHDDTWSQVLVLEHSETSRQQRRQTVMQAKHGLTRCPVVIGTRPTMDGTYSGEFIGGLGVLDYWNKLMTLVMDDAVRKVYPERITYNVMNPEDYGPDANIQLETPDARYEYVAQGNQPFSNLQVLRDVGQSVRTSFLMPLSRSGDPNESIISAAGVNATQGQYIEDVRSIQRDVLSPMFTAALDIAAEGDIVWADVSKPIGGGSEKYRPSKDVHGHVAEVRYGAASGLDEINQNVMVLQQLGARIIDRRTAMEMSPFVEDPQRVEKRMLKETMQDAMLAGLAQQAQQGAIDPFQLSMIDQAIESDEVSLSEAIAAFAPQAPLAPPAATPGAPPEAPGMAGAAEGPQESNMPPLAELLGP